MERRDVLRILSAAFVAPASVLRQAVDPLRAVPAAVASLDVLHLIGWRSPPLCTPRWSEAPLLPEPAEALADMTRAAKADGVEVWARSGHRTLRQHRYLWNATYAWTAFLLNLGAFVLPVNPRARRNFATPNIGCAAIYAGVYIEKGMGLILPGLTPDAVGEIYEYRPTLTEFQIAAGIFAAGFLVSMLMLKVAMPIALGEFHTRTASSDPPIARM